LKRKLVLTAKALVTLGLLTYLALSLDFSLLAENLSRLNVGLFIGVTAIHFLSLVPVEAYRLYIVFPYEGSRLQEFTKLALFNAFFRNLLPSNLGPSVYTIIYLQRNIGSNLELITRMLLLRVLGLFTLLVLVLAYLVYDFAAISNQFHFQIEYSLVGYALASLFFTASLTFVLRKTRLIHAIQSRIAQALKVLRSVSFREISLILLASVIYHLIRGVAFWGLAIALGVEITLGLAIFLLSANAILLLLPISIGGIGLQESFLIFALGAFGVLIEPAAALVFLYRVLLLIMGLIGGVAYFLNLSNVRKG
jgi:uncharacterized membrane protein YbhN (UPF0104 family)